MREKADNDNMPVRYGPWLPSRAMARERGAKSYFTGKTCLNGHTTYRLVSSGHCSACSKVWDNDRLKDPARRDSVRLAVREAQRRRRKDPEFNERERAYDRERRLDPSVGERERNRMRERRTDPAYKAKEEEYKRAHPEMQAVTNHRRRARKNAAGGTHTKHDITELLKKQKNLCAFCGAKLKKRADWHLDHITPFAKGGSNWPSNLQILCVTCNLEKHVLDAIEFARRKGRLL